MRLHDHGEVGVVRLWHVLLVLAQLDGDDVAEVRAGVVPGRGVGGSQGCSSLSSLPRAHLEPASVGDTRMPPVHSVAT